MKALIVYDSKFGNTKEIAKAIGEGISELGEVKTLRPSEVNTSELSSLDLLIVGSPTHGGRATQKIKDFLSKIPSSGLKNIKVAAFDTRIEGKDKGIGIRVLTGVLGYAAGRIAKSLKNKGGNEIVPPEGFIVEDREGPLKQGELKRASDWAKKITKSVEST